MNNANYTDIELLECLYEIGQCNANISDWEADFIESLIMRDVPVFSAKQKAVIVKLITKYLAA